MAKNIVFKVSADTTGVTTGMNQAADATNKATKSVSQLDKSLGNLAGMVAGAFALSELTAFGKEVVKVTSQVQSLAIRMEAIVGSEELAGKKLVELRVIAEQLGLEFKSLATNYTQFVSAAKSSGMEVAKAETIFLKFSKAITASGASSEQASRAFVALTQMMGKGQIMAEEWKSQFSEAIPQAMGWMQKATGKTTAELMKLMEQGKLSADILSDIARVAEQETASSIEKMANSIQGDLNRLENAWTDLYLTAGNTLPLEKGIKTMTFFINGLKNALIGGKVLLVGAYSMITRDTEKLAELTAELAKNSADQFRAEKAIEATKYAQSILDLNAKESAEEQVKILERRANTLEQSQAKHKNLTEAEIRDNIILQEKAQALRDLALSLLKTKQDTGKVSEAEIKRLEKQKEVAIKLRLEMEKALRDVYKVDFANLPEPSGDGAFPGALGEKAKREARIREATEAEQLAKDMREFELSQQEREIQDFKDKEAQKTEIAKQQQEQRKANEVALYSGLASTAQAWGQRELSIQQANLDKRREQGVISEEQYLNQLKAIKRKQFMLDKLGAVAQIAINTAVNVSQASNPIMLPLVPGIIASGAIQAGIVLAQPIPYKKGTKRVPMVRGAVRGEDSVHAILTPGERVITEGVNSQPGYSALLDLAQDRKISDKEAGFLAEVATSGMRPAKNATIDPEVFGKAIAKHIPGTKVNIDENGIMVITERSTYESKRLRTRL